MGNTQTVGSSYKAGVSAPNNQVPSGLVLPPAPGNNSGIVVPPGTAGPGVGSTQTIVSTPSLPAGTYSIMAQGLVRGGGTAGIVTLSIVYPGTPLVYVDNWILGDSNIHSMFLNWVGAITSPQTFLFQCVSQSIIFTIPISGAQGYIGTSLSWVQIA